MRNHFYEIFREVTNDRDRNRAHRFEKNKNEKDAVPLLNIYELEKKFNEIENILNNIRMFHTYSSYTLNDINFSNSDRMAQSIVDLVLIGDRDYIEFCFGIQRDLLKFSKKYTYQYRDEYYKRALNSFQNNGAYSKHNQNSIPIDFVILLNKEFNKK